MIRVPGGGVDSRGFWSWGELKVDYRGSIIGASGGKLMYWGWGGGAKMVWFSSVLFTP